ncbi:MAG: class I poly(R)-hydroxyalkanoic acid synthase [Betaproteobacteria bacterium RIFCSPLOWO2_12_FULL_62_13]|nr:MAG: class I poly(R)-hydroxyalkanoic acid synthase [Betaproteobacteria bacterium RIFCSPLOWO2_12_FULL_62_13]
MNQHTNAIEALSALNHRLVEAMLKPLADGGGPVVAEIFRSLAADIAQDTKGWLDIQNRYYEKQLQLWASLPARTSEPDPAAAAAPVIAPDPTDRRFRAREWREPYFSFLVQSYLLRARWFDEIVGHARLEPHAKKKLTFFTRQVIDAMSPANFPWSNPEALKLAAETQGESLTEGLKNLAADLEKGLVSMTDERAFEVGRNLAITPGAVVFENDFMQLIQYRPATDTVHERPLLIVPPCINKYYILDLQPDNSFVCHAVEHGHTVFMVSWRNMPASMGRATWDDYLEQGVIQGISLVTEICRVEKINTLGFCVGGTLLGSALAVLRAKGHDPVASLTLLASMLDFCDTGELGVFVDDAYVMRRELDFAGGGVLHGKELALTFASLRANDLIWQYVVSNYLKGKTPDPFDLLFWNSDSTNLPGAMYVYYVRNMYLENNLRSPGKLMMCGVPVDLRHVDMPAYVLATREDHIVPWKTAYASARLLNGKIEFALAASGHIAGIINPPSRNRRNYWLNAELGDDPERWFAAAASHPGSWWTHWSAWLAQHGGVQVGARMSLGGGRYPEIEPAPGRYVKEKCT